MQVIKQDAQDVSPPLTELVKMSVPEVAERAHEAEPVRSIPHMRAQSAGQVADPVVQNAIGGPLIPTTSTNFEGMGAGLAGFTVDVAPSDASGDIGPNRYVQIVNTSVAIFNRTGGIVLGPTSTRTFWAGFNGQCANANDGDGVVRYDRYADRWVISQFSINGGNGPFLQCIAVSTTGDPAGAYNRYQFSFPAFNDYPKLGLWSDAYYFTYNLFSATFLGAEVCAVDRAKMIAGQAANQVCFTTANQFGSLLPEDADGPTLPPTGEPNCPIALDTSALDRWCFHVDFATPANSTFTGPTTIPVAAYTPLCNGGTCVVQPGTTNRLDSLADRLMNRAVYRKFPDHESLLVTHAVAVGTRGGVRWYELRLPPICDPRVCDPAIIFQQGTYAPDPSFRWMSSAAFDGTGDIGLGFSISSSTINPGIRYTGRLPTDPLGTMGQGEGTIVMGTGSQTGNLTRWGDYSSLNIDPTDDCRFWYTQQYMGASGSFNWHTRIGSFRFPSCDGTPNGLTIQLLDTPDIAGNTRVTVIDDPAPGTTAPPYLVVGLTENPIILRDDGVGADLKANDHVYSVFANGSSTAFATRNSNEVNLINQFGIQTMPTFTRRTVSGSAVAVPFNLLDFNQHSAVAFDPSIIIAPAGPSPDKALLVHDPNTVGTGDPTRTWDPCTSTGTRLGAFTFGHLMTEMANTPLTGINPSTLVMQWLQTWQTTQTINTFNVPARPNIATQIINPWLTASGGTTLDLGIAPFRLLAIVNRLDLRTGSSTYGGSTGNAGELRFVFGAVRVLATGGCQLLPFTVILEYGVPIRGCENVRSWAQQWVNLSSLTLGTGTYNAALQAITDQVVLRNAAPGKPNGSALNQVRTNEIALASPWELRQFGFLSSVDVLHETPVSQTPDVRFNAHDPGWSGSTLLDTFIVTTPPGTEVPLSFMGTHFLGGSAPVTNNDLGYFWNTSTLDLNPLHPGNFNEARHLFSLHTCNGCHAGETLTSFTHIDPMKSLGDPSFLSKFLTGGITVNDPAFGAPPRPEGDLARRQVDLVNVANSLCLAFPMIDPAHVQQALAGQLLPSELVLQPVPPVSQQGTFFVEDFFKTPVLVH